MHWQRPTQEHAWWKRRTTVCRVFSCYVFAWRCASALRPAGADGRMFRRHILNSGAQEASKRFPGGYRSRVTPVPIPNTEVKPATADGTAWVTVWESRSLPGIYPGAARKARPFFVSRPLFSVSCRNGPPGRRVRICTCCAQSRCFLRSTPRQPTLMRRLQRRGMQCLRTGAFSVGASVELPVRPVWPRRYGIARCSAYLLWDYREPFSARPQATLRGYLGPETAPHPSWVTGNRAP